MDIKLLTGGNRQWPPTTKSFQQTYLVSAGSTGGGGGDGREERENEGVERARIRAITHTERHTLRATDYYVSTGSFTVLSCAHITTGLL